MGDHSGTNTRPNYKTSFDPTQTYFEDSVGPTATIKEIYIHVMLENSASVKAAATGWTKMSQQLAGIKADLDAQQNKLVPKWSSDAATAFYGQMDMSGQSLTEWQQVASDNAKAMSALGGEIDRLKKEMVTLWKKFDADVKNGKSRLDHSWWLRKAQDLHDWASGEGDFDVYVEQYTKLANSRVLDPLNQAYTDAFNAVATGSIFGGPTNSILATPQQIAEAMGMSAPALPGAGSVAPVLPDASPPLPAMPSALGPAPTVPTAPGPLPTTPPAPAAPRAPVAPSAPVAVQAPSAVPPPLRAAPPDGITPPDELTEAPPRLPTESLQMPTPPPAPVDAGPAPLRGGPRPAAPIGRPGAPAEPEQPGRPGTPRPTLRGRGAGMSSEPTEPPTPRNPGSQLSGRRRGGGSEPAEPRPGRPVAQEPETPPPGRGGPALPGRTARRRTEPPEESVRRSRPTRLGAPRPLQGMRDVRPRFRPGSVEAEEPALRRMQTLEGRLATEPTEPTPEPLRPELAGRGRRPAQAVENEPRPGIDTEAVDFVGDAELFAAAEAAPSVIERPEEVKPVVPERAALRPGPGV